MAAPVASNANLARWRRLLMPNGITPPVRGHSQCEAVSSADIFGLRVAAPAQHKPLPRHS
jgi:hypothetical protein